MERFREIVDRLLALCAVRREIEAVIAIGSQCRTAQGADEYSDLDLVVVCGTPEGLLYEDGWLERLGQVEYSFVEDTIAGQRERRVLFAGSLDVDFIIMPPEAFGRAAEEGALNGLMGRGYALLYDGRGWSPLLERRIAAGRERQALPTQWDFRNLVQDFCYHMVWAEKKLRRGELWTAKMCVDGYLKGRLLRMIELYEACLHGADFDVWHNGRLLERWAEEDVVRELGQCFARYDGEDIRRALAHTAALFTRLARACGERWGYQTGVEAVDNPGRGSA